jgi:hypothetical protein
MKIKTDRQRERGIERKDKIVPTRILSLLPPFSLFALVSSGPCGDISKLVVFVTVGAPENKLECFSPKNTFSLG